MNTADLKWAFFSYGNNLGDFTRALETAGGMAKTGAGVKFFNHGGIHRKLITEAGIESKDLQPELSWEQHEVIMDINRYRVPIGTPLPVSKQEWIRMARADIEAMEDYKPDGVYAGLSLSCRISIPYLKLPMVTQVPTVNCPAFIHKGLYNLPNNMEKNFFTRHILPGVIKRKIMKRILLRDSAKATLTTFNEARAHFGLGPIHNITDLVRGEITLLPDLPVLSGLSEEELTPGYYYTAPIFWKPDLPLPEEVKQVFGRPGTNIFCSMGSSGFPETLRLIVDTLRKEKEYNVVCATTTILDPDELGGNNDRFYATRFLPAHMVNEMADIAFIHGGQGTVQTAAWSGTPVVGVGFQAEQQANIDGLVKAGAAVRIPIYSVKPRTILKALQKVSGRVYREKAGELKNTLRATDGVAKSVEVMNAFVTGKL
jgi:UDP:flavonoid glycosyltransferase YjiC (YdhE family)